MTDGSTSQITNTHYSEGFQYTEDHLDFFPHAEGYVNVIDYSAFNYVYTYKDHLGNIRLKYTLDPDTNETAILEENHYYPYGLTHQGYNADHKFLLAIDEVIELVEVTSIMDDKYKYKYQEQERQDELGLNWDSFKWRNYMPDIGRFFNIDPLTEEYHTWSPYVYSGNRVIDARELEGLEPRSVHKTLDDAAINFGQQYNGRSIISKKEYASRFYSSTGKDGNTTYSYVEPLIGSGSGTFIPEISSLPKGTSNAGTIHTHGNDEPETIEGERDSDNVPSYEDIESTKEGDLPSYVVIPAGKVLKIDPNTGEVTTVSTDVPSDPASGSKRTNSINPSLQPYVPSKPSVETEINFDKPRLDTPNIDQMFNPSQIKF